MNKALILTEEEAFALLRLAMFSSEDQDDEADSAVRKLAGLCRGFLAEPIPA